VKSKSLDVAVVCGPCCLLLTNFVASCRHDIQSRVHFVVAIMLTKLYDVCRMNSRFCMNGDVIKLKLEYR